MTEGSRKLHYHILGTEDFRRKGGNFRYPVEVILTIAFLAYLCGARSSRKYEMWGCENIEALKRHGLALPHGIPSHYTFARFFEKMPPELLKNLARRWSDQLVDLPKGSVVALDGKAFKHASTDGIHIPYNVTAWVSEFGFALAERVTDEKSNEITALPKILDELGTSIAECVVTIDAAGCQKEIARKVVEVNHADYVFGLKGNQKTMHDEFLELFDHAMTMYPDRFETDVQTEKNRGRFEERVCTHTDFVEWFPERNEWIGLNGVIMVKETRRTAKKETTDRRLYASSLPMDAKNAQRCVRQHWGVENGLHWTLDVIFDEDKCRLRTGYAAENMSNFRHILVGILKQKSRETGMTVDQLRFKAICSQEFLFDLFF